MNIGKVIFIGLFLITAIILVGLLPLAAIVVTALGIVALFLIFGGR